MNKKSKIALEIIIHCLFGLICFISMLLLQGVQPSISEFAKFPITDIIFKTWLVVLAFGSLRNKHFKYALLPLLGVVIFDVGVNDTISTLHNICAVSFFLLVIIQFLRRNKTRIFGILSLLCLPLLFVNIFWGEVLAISITYIYFLNAAYNLINEK